MINSGAHVKIGSYEYLLDESQENHYVHRMEPGIHDNPRIEGMDKLHTKRNRLLWSIDDWSGGEGAYIYQPEDPFAYNESLGLNGRNRGQLTGRPNRTVTSSFSPTDVDRRPVFAIGDDACWLGGSKDLYYTQDFASWTQKTDAQTGFDGGTPYSNSYDITAMAGDNNYLYYSAWHSGSSGSRVTLRIARSGGYTAVEAEATNKAPYAGLAFMGGRLYAWTGRKLFEMDVYESCPLNSKYIRKVGDTGTEPSSTNVFGTQWWANCVEAENAVFAFYTTDAQSQVYQYRHDSGFGPIWRGPRGFSIKSMKYQNGVLFMAGHWGGDSNVRGYGALYAMPLDTYRPVFVSWFRRHVDSPPNLEMQEMAESYGSQILVAAARSGRIFVYDADLDSVSMLDDLDNVTDTDALVFASNKERIGDMITYGTKRAIAIFNPQSGTSTDWQVVTYDDDMIANRQAATSTADYSTYLTSAAWDFNYPFEAKGLIGFHLAYKVENTATTSGLKAGQEIKVEYSVDDDQTWATAATITSATTPSSGVQGRHFIAVASGSTTKKFYNLRIRITLYGKRVSSTNYQAPIVYGLTAEAVLLSYIETWDLILRVKDEQDHTRPSHRKVGGAYIRDYLEDLTQNKDVVTFLDGYRYKQNNTYTTHTVIVEDPIDIIDRHAEGSMRIRLRAIAS